MANNPHCEVCDHCIVYGVACDGPTTDCSLIGCTQVSHGWRFADTRMELIAQGGPEEFEAIRGWN